MISRRATMGEFEAIELLRGLLEQRTKSVAAVGIGDDAAVLYSRRRRLVWTVDASVEGVHFDRRWLSLEDVGWRSFEAATSDIAAMGARPLAALSSLVVPGGFRARQLRELGAGQSSAARDLGCPVVGGNIARGTALSVTTTVLGEAGAVLLRSGARVGDELWLVGNVGLARAGWQAIERAGPGRARSWMRRRTELERAAAMCLEAWRRPRALVRRGLALASRAHAAIDLSDGLGGDAGKLAAASGVRVVVESGALEKAIAAELRVIAHWLGTSATALALRGGEDYALLTCGRARQRPRWARRIGRIERGPAGAVLEGAHGDRPLGPGFDHLTEA